MAIGQLGGVLRQLQKTGLLHNGLEPTDGQLLEQYLRARDGDAFAALVARHGPMVLGVCRRLLRNEADAEDAFQATFLVLVRKAASIIPRELVGNWLYGVAYHTALKARAAAVRRRAKEQEVGAMQRPEPARVVSEELRERIDHELLRLPDRYRIPLILCELGGKSYQDAARQIGCPVGTVSGRLTRARQLLARRLSRYGLELAGGALATWTPPLSPAAVPPALAGATVKAAARAASALPVTVAALTQEVLRAMNMTKIKIATLFVLATAAVAGVGVPTYRALAAVRSDADYFQTDSIVTLRLEAVPSAVVAADEVVKGSGKEATKEFKLSDFTAVDVGGAFKVEITRGDAYRVAVTSDDNLFEFIKVTKDGSTLHINLETGKKSIQNGKWTAAVTMPKLEGVSVHGASQASLKGFTDAEVKGRVDGASRLTGELAASKLDLEASGASQVTLTGSIKDAKLKCTGASKLLLTDCSVDRADIHLAGASTARLKVKEKLDYDLSGASHLQYQGDPTIGTKKSTGASSAAHKSA